MPQWHAGEASPSAEEAAAISVGYRQLLSCPALIILLYDPERRAPASERDLPGVISLGCVLENMWLMAHSLGIHVHVAGALSEENAQNAIRKMLDIPQSLQIALSFRLGYPPEECEYLRVRRNEESFVHFNGFGRKAKGKV